MYFSSLLLNKKRKLKVNRSNDLDDTDLVGDIKSIIITSQSNVSFLLSVGSDQEVHLGYLDFVEFTNGGTDVILVGLQVSQEDEGVVVFNLLHGGFSGQWVLDDVLSNHAIPGWNSLPWVLGLTWKLQGFWSAEMNRSADLTGSGSEGTFDYL